MLVVVPTPSGIVRRLRGRLVVAHLADAVIRGICVQWVGQESAASVLSTDSLRHRGGEVHQAGRSARQRRDNRAQASRLLVVAIGLPILLIDDVVTIGATPGARARALWAGGGWVLDTLVLNVALLPAYAHVTAPVGPGVVVTGRRTSGRMDPGASILSICGDQEASFRRDAYERGV